MSIKKVLSLKQFMQRSDVIRLYRDCFLAIRHVDDPDYKVYLKDWVRDRFGYHTFEEDPSEIKVLLQQGRNELGQFLQTMTCATSTHRTFRSSPPPMS
eukprot:m.34858 g.34858  ORF g.34858 m.34858 type:complete len:98 (+) comp12718_c0_seq1:206-499(+)